MKFRGSKKAVTLLEMLITMGIFSLMMGTICAIFNAGFNFYRKGAGDAQSFQMAVIALDRISRDMQDRTAMQLYYPQKDDFMSPKSSQGIVFVKQYPEQDRLEVIGYYINQQRKEIFRVLYNQEYDPAITGTQIEKPSPGSKRVIARNITGLSFKGEDKGLMTIEIVIDGKYEWRNLRTKIRNEALLR